MPKKLSLSAVIGFLLAIPFLITGSIFPSMLVHTAFGVIAGIRLAGRRLRW